MNRLVDMYFRALKFAVVACLSSMVILVFGNVVLRYVFNSGIAISEEFSRWLFVWLTIFGATIALREHTHLGMDSVVSRLPITGKKVAFVLSHAMMIGCVLIMLYGGWYLVVVNNDIYAAATGLPISMFYGVEVVFAISALPLLVYELFIVVTGKVTEDDLVQIRDSEEEVDYDRLEAGVRAKPDSAAR
jgi:TRAP-type C4-dicarboxylate transport system permease small subunit